MSTNSSLDINIQSLFTPEQTADVLGITPGTLSVWRTTGRYNLPFVKVGGRCMYRPEDIKAFIESRLHAHTA